jgi:hypothetical protein
MNNEQKLRLLRHDPKLFDGTASEMLALEREIKALNKAINDKANRVNERYWVAPYTHEKCTPH